MSFSRTSTAREKLPAAIWDRLIVTARGLRRAGGSNHFVHGWWGVSPQHPREHKEPSGCP